MTVFVDCIDGFLTDVLAIQGRHPNIGRRDGRQPVPREVRRAVYQRDGNRCTFCGDYRNLQLDHIEPWSAGGCECPENLRAMCAGCNVNRSNWPTLSDRQAMSIGLGCCGCALDEMEADDALTTAFCMVCLEVLPLPDRWLIDCADYQEIA